MYFLDGTVGNLRSNAQGKHSFSPLTKRVLGYFLLIVSMFSRDSF